MSRLERPPIAGLSKQRESQKPLKYKFEGLEKPSQGQEKVRQKLFQVLIDISRISLIDYLDNQDSSTM
jgi:hypothetical protein